MTETYEFEWAVNLKRFENSTQNVVDIISEQIYKFIKEYNAFLKCKKGDFVIDDPYYCGKMSLALNVICISLLPNSGNRVPDLIMLYINHGGQVMGKLDPEKDSPEARDFFDFLRNKISEYSHISTNNSI